MDKVTKEHFDRANLYSPRPARSYKWIWDYTRYSFEWAFQRGREVEDKAISLLKFLLAIAAGAWAVFIYFNGKGAVFISINNPIGLAAIIAGAGALVSIVVAGWFTFGVFSATRHLYPISEEAALSCADTFEREDQAMAKFCQAFSSSTDKERENTTAKAKRLNRAFVFIGVSLSLFATALLLLTVVH